jgi:hypothetical protein
MSFASFVSRRYQRIGTYLIPPRFSDWYDVVNLFLTDFRSVACVCLPSFAFPTFPLIPAPI